jgi:signal transduction histidine kinase
MDVPPDVELPEATEGLLFRVAQEALRNVASHADASYVDVRVQREDARVTLEVGDDGRGFEAGAGRPSGHFGLSLIEDLARDAGADLSVRSAPGEGTRVRLEAKVAES